MILPTVIRRYLDAYNRRDVDALVACVAEDVVFENVSNAGPSMLIGGRDAFADLAHRSASLFENRCQTVRTAVIEGNLIALEVDWTGIPTIDLGPMKAGASATMRGASFITIAKGRISRIVDLS